MHLRPPSASAPVSHCRPAAPHNRRLHTRRTGRRLENARLHLGRQLRVHWQNDELGRFVNLRQPLSHHNARDLDVLLARHENENVAGRVREVHRERLLDRRLDIVLVGRARKEHVDRKCAARNVEDRNVAKEARKLFGVHRGRRHNQLEIEAARHNVAQNAKQHVGVKRAFVRLVHNNGWPAWERKCRACCEQCDARTRIAAAHPSSGRGPDR